MDTQRAVINRNQAHGLLADLTVNLIRLGFTSLAEEVVHTDEIVSNICLDIFFSDNDTQSFWEDVWPNDNAVTGEYKNECPDDTKITHRFTAGDVRSLLENIYTSGALLDGMTEYTTALTRVLNHELEQMHIAECLRLVGAK